MLLAWVLVSSSMAADTTELPDRKALVESLTSTIEILEDTSASLGIEAVSQPPANAAFVAATPKSANVGFSTSTWWVRFTLRNPAPEPRLVYVRQDYPLIDSISLHEPQAGGGWRVTATGDRTPFESRPVIHRDFLFPVSVPPQSENTYYLRYSSQGPVDINLSLLGPDELAESLTREQLAYGVYFGCVLMLLVWSGLVFVAVRDEAFLAYFAYVATFGIYMLVNTGFAFQYLWPGSPRWANTCLIVMLNAALIAALHFSITILRARDYTPRLFRVARAMQILAAFGVALAPFVGYAGLVRATTLLIFTGVILMIALGIVNVVSGSRPARFYVVAWGAFLVGSVIFLLKNYGAIPHTFMSQHSWQVGALVEMILLSMTLSSRMNELKHQSRTDSLTLLGNRRLFDDRLPAEFMSANEEGKPLSLLMIDIDKFKLYNDLHGHSLGDEAVKVVASALRRHARKPFFACRFGGDEFCAILPGASEATAAVVAERLRAAIQHALSGEQTVTVSIGFACHASGRFASHERLFEAADAALYTAKQQGRNCIAAFQGRRSDDPPANVASSPG